jgi:hypothetical protein
MPKQFGNSIFAALAGVSDVDGRSVYVGTSD